MPQKNITRPKAIASERVMYYNILCISYLVCSYEQLNALMRF